MASSLSLMRQQRWERVRHICAFHPEFPVAYAHVYERPCHHVSTEPAAPSHQGHEHAHCTTGHGKDVNGMNDDDDDGEDGQPCRFGRPCGVMLTDFSEDGLNRHLAQYHLQDLQDSIVRTP